MALPIKISAMPALAVPPGSAGAVVPVVVPGDNVNYKSPIATLLTGAINENITVTLYGTGLLILVGVPPADPNHAGALWSNNGFLCISQG